MKNRTMVLIVGMSFAFAWLRLASGSLWPAVWGEKIAVNKVYLAIPGSRDRVLGRVDQDGTIYRSHSGLDERVGRVDLASGAILRDRFGPDKQVGHVHLKNGKVYASRMGPDEYVGRVEGTGRMHRCLSSGTEAYVGRTDHFCSYGHSGGAFLLLVLPERVETTVRACPVHLCSSADSTRSKARQ